MKPSHLRGLLIAGLLSIQVGTVAAIMLSNQRATDHQYTTRSYERVQKMANIVATQARSFLDPAENFLTGTRDMLFRGSLNLADDRAVREHFMMALQLKPSLRGLTLAHADGRYLTVTRSRDGLVVTQRKSTLDKHVSLTVFPEHPTRAEPTRNVRLDYDPKVRPWYQESGDPGVVGWTQPYVFYNSETPGLSASMRLRSGLGSDETSVLAAHVTVDELSTFVGIIPESQGGTAALVNRDFVTVAFAGNGQTRLRAGPQGTFSLNDIAGMPLRDLQKKVSNDAGTFDQHSSGFTRLNIDGVEHLGIVRPFSLSNDQMNWQLMVQAPASEFAGGTAPGFLQNLWLLIGGITLSSLAAVLGIIRVTAPVYDLHRTATVDRLTGALSRSEFERRMAPKAGNRRRNSNACQHVLVALDLDGFKQVNDTHGHGAGDRVLINFVSRLRRCMRRQDMVARLGGDEFVMSMKLDLSTDPVKIVEEIRNRAVAAPIVVDGHRLKVGATAGIAIRGAGESVNAALERADHALVSGKAHTKNRCYLASSAVQAKALPASQGSTRNGMFAVPAPPSPSLV